VAEARGDKISSASSILTVANWQILAAELELIFEKDNKKCAPQEVSVQKLKHFCEEMNG
jgi:hypothetical protein